MQNFYALTIEELSLQLSEWRIPRFRTDQIWNWVYANGVSDFDKMNNLPKKLRLRLKESFVLGTAEIDIEQKSEDGTVKRLYRLPDGALIESVLMPYRDGRRTACISSQVGCAMACRFCATGQMGFVRQLLPEELLEQALHYATLLQS